MEAAAVRVVDRRLAGCRAPRDRTRRDRGPTPRRRRRRRARVAGRGKGAIRWRRQKAGRLWATVIWKVGRQQRTHALHTCCPIVAHALFGAWKSERRDKGRHRPRTAQEEAQREAWRSLLSLWETQRATVGRERAEAAVRVRLAAGVARPESAVALPSRSQP